MIWNDNLLFFKKSLIISSSAERTETDLFINEAREDLSGSNDSSRQMSLSGGGKKSNSMFSFFVGGQKQSKTQVITAPTTSDITRAEPKNFLIHLNVKAMFAALPPRESPKAAKRPVVSHLFTPAAAGCHWDSEGEIPWFSLPFLTAPSQTTLIRDCGQARG